ncbi:MAG: 3-carboxy-cis,cis-muconate cycloisomerase [Acidobacteriales bacterium]|nr:3-carboxy-cis,cis-muconate cycloisomerase [Terriglobales bacterium]
MPVRLIESMATTEPLAELFSDQSVLEAMLKFEVALARAEASLGVLPQKAAEVIASAASVPGSFNGSALALAAQRAGTPSIPLVKALTDTVRVIDPSAAGFVHWGATSQDVADTALILLLKQSQPILNAGIERLDNALLRLAEENQNTVMLGRTLMQPAPPVTFGLKAAAWRASVVRGRKRLTASFADALILQFGGASGTLASLGEQGMAVAEQLAKELDLRVPDAPWHTQRDRLGWLMCACSVLTGSLGKMARDLSLMMQAEIGEASESGGQGRGGSSTMPHKRNPIGCMTTLAAAQRVPFLVASFLSGMVQEHERGLGGWQAEWLTVAEVIQATGLAIGSMAEVAEGLTIHPTKMRANIDATRGAVFAEKATMLLGEKLGRDTAHKLLEKAVLHSMKQSISLVAALREMPEVVGQLDAKTLSQLEIPEEYLGSAEAFRKRLLATEEDAKTEE